MIFAIAGWIIGAWIGSVLGAQFIGENIPTRAKFAIVLSGAFLGAAVGATLDMASNI